MSFSTAGYAAISQVDHDEKARTAITQLTPRICHCGYPENNHPFRHPFSCETLDLPKEMEKLMNECKKIQEEVKRFKKMMKLFDSKS